MKYECKLRVNKTENYKNYKKKKIKMAGEQVT